MKVVKERAEARWLPSRFHLAMFRLFAFLRLKTAKPQPQPGLVLAIERHQTAAENYLDGACTFVVVGSYVASLLADAFPLGTACAIAVIVTITFMSAEVVVAGVMIEPVVKRFVSGVVVNSALWMILTITCATLLCVSTSPLRHIGTSYLILVAANAAAALIVLIMQRSIAEAERRYGVEA